MVFPSFSPDKYNPDRTDDTSINKGSVCPEILSHMDYESWHLIHPMCQPFPFACPNEQVDYTETSDVSDAVYGLQRGDNEGLLDVHALRDEYGADLVQLVGFYLNTCGIGYVHQEYAIHACHWPGPSRTFLKLF